VKTGNNDVAMSPRLFSEQCNKNQQSHSTDNNWVRCSKVAKVTLKINYPPTPLPA